VDIFRCSPVLSWVPFFKFTSAFVFFFGFISPPFGPFFSFGRKALFFLSYCLVFFRLTVSGGVRLFTPHETLTGVRNAPLLLFSFHAFFPGPDLGEMGSLTSRCAILV